MKNTINKINVAILAIAMLITSMTIPSAKVNAATNKYLVLVQTKVGKWTQMTNVAKKNGANVVIKTSNVAKKLGFKVSTSGKKVTVTKSKKAKNVYTSGSKKYKYNKKTKNAPIKATKTYVSYKTFSTLVKGVKYVTSGIDDYKAKGYNGVILFSNVSKNIKVPSYASLTSSSSKTTTIGGVKFNVYDGFNSNILKDGKWTSGSNHEPFKALDEAIQKYMFKNADWERFENYDGDTIMLYKTYMAYAVNGDDRTSDLILKPSSDNKYFELHIYSALDGAKTNEEKAMVYAKKLVMKAMLASITSSYQKVYDTIYQDFTSTEVVSTKKWKKFGNTMIKAKINKSEHEVIYMIKKS